MQVAEYTFFTIIFTIAVTGNTLVCLVIFQTPRMRTTRNYLLVNLAVSDLMVALFCIPFDVVLKVTQPVWPLGYYSLFAYLVMYRLSRSEISQGNEKIRL